MRRDAMTVRLKSREADPEPNATLWLVTYADMMTLLLCFFIMLVAMSEVKSEKFQRMLESMRRAFGVQAGMEAGTGSPARRNSLFENVQALRVQGGRGNMQGGAETINVHGREFLCKTVKDGLLITMGDKVGFEQGSAEISGDMKADLNAIIGLVKDYSNRVLVGGHTSAQEVGDETGQWELAFQRAAAVGKYLEESGINPRRLKLSASGGFNPVDTDLTAEGRGRNRRVEITVSEDLVRDAVPGRGGI